MSLFLPGTNPHNSRRMAEEEESVTGAYPASDDEEAVVGPYPGGADDDAYDEYPDTNAQFGADVVGPYPGGEEDGDDVVGPYPGGADDDDAYDAYPDTDAQYGGDSHDAIGPPVGPAAPRASPPPMAAAPPAVAAAPPPPSAQAPPSSAPAPPRWRPPEWSKPPQLHQPKIEAWENGRCARSMSLRGAPVFIVGRNGQQADVIVADNSVSRAHAAIINSSSATFVQDLSSAHGTFYDDGGRTAHIPQLGTRLDPQAAPTKLVEGATIRFGTYAATVYKIVGLQASTVERWRPPPWSAPPRADRVLLLEVRSTSVSNPYLQHLADDGGDVDEVIAVSSACTIFGRSSHADVVLREQHNDVV